MGATFDQGFRGIPRSIELNEMFAEIHKSQESASVGSFHIHIQAAIVQFGLPCFHD